MYLNLLTLITLFCLADIRFPTRTESVVEPVPEAVEVIVDTLGESEWFIVDSDQPLIVLASPVGIVGVEPLTGPMTFRGKFPGSTRFETRTFQGPYLFAVTAEQTGKAELIVVDPATLEVVRQVLTVSGIGPNPPPIVDPPVIDPPVVDPPTPPVPIGKLQVIIIEDPAQHASLPASQIAVLDGQAVREYLNTHCTVTDGTPDRRILSVRQVVTAKSAPWLQEAFAVPRESLPWIVILRGSKTISGPLPETVDETMALLRTYGGP